MFPFVEDSGLGNRTLDILGDARARGAAVGAFTVYSLEGIRAVVEAAEATGRSAILQVYYRYITGILQVLYDGDRNLEQLFRMQFMISHNLHKSHHIHARSVVATEGSPAVELRSVENGKHLICLGQFA